jgi:hypothetical protein
MDKEFSKAVLLHRYSDIGVNFRIVWDLYIKFYSVFLTFSVAALAWLASKDDPFAAGGSERWTVVAAFVIQSLFTALTSAKIALYSGEVVGQLSQFSDDAATFSEESDVKELCKKTSLPTNLARYAGWANFLSMLALAIVWIVVGTLGA